MSARYSPEVVNAMRDWILDCQWADEDADSIAEKTEREIIMGVSLHFDGGITGFLRTMP